MIQPKIDLCCIIITIAPSQIIISKDEFIGGEEFYGSSIISTTSLKEYITGDDKFIGGAEFYGSFLYQQHH